MNCLRPSYSNNSKSYSSKFALFMTVRRVIGPPFSITLTKNGFYKNMNEDFNALKSRNYSSKSANRNSSLST
jgi:hypothetical protein